MVWNPSLHCCITLIAVFRFMCTGLVFWVFIRHNDTPLVKASGQELCYILLLGVFMSYAMTFLLLAKPSPAICALRRLGLGTSFAVCYSALLTKTNRIARIFNGVKDGVGTVRPRFISPSSQVSRWSRVSMHMQQVVNVYDVDWMSSVISRCSSVWVSFPCNWLWFWCGCWWRFPEHGVSHCRRSRRLSSSSVTSVTPACCWH